MTLTSLCENIPEKSIKIFGSGGSKTVIIITPERKVYKYFTVLSYKDTDNKWVKKEMSGFKTEINIQKELTRHIVITNLSHHVVRLDDSLFCKSSPHFLFEDCPSFEKILKTPAKETKLRRECNYLFEGYPIKIEKGFLIANIEYCPLTLGNVIFKLMRKTNKTLENNLNRILFQLVFTLSVIQKKYPYFVHHDLFMRNILATDYRAKKNDYFRYYFDDYVFDVPVKGYMVKIADFGLSNLNEKNKNTPKLVKSQHEDIFNIIYDIYNGQNLGAVSCMSIAKKRKNKNKEEFLHQYFSRFINTELIQEIENNRKKRYINSNWRMLYDSKMAKLFKVKLPRQYLKQFVKIYPRNDSHNIVMEFGE